MPPAVGSNSLSSPAYVHISQDVWQPADRIRWPSKEKAIKVYYSLGKLASDYALSKSQVETLAKSPNEIRVGDLKGDLVILTQSPSLNSDELRDFVSAHEAFHLAAQYYGSKIPLDRLGPFSTQNDQKVDEFWEEIARVSLAYRQTPADCQVLQSKFGSLSEIDQEFVLGKSFWEWPAEYYARTSVLAGATDNEYFELRSKIQGNNRLYLAGSLALDLVARKHSDRTWQFEIASGTNAINLFMGAIGCEGLDPARGFGEITETKFIHDE